MGALCCSTGHTLLVLAIKGCICYREPGERPVEGVGLDAADVVGLHAVQGLHELAQLALEAAAHRRELVPLPHLALRTHSLRVRNCEYLICLKTGAEGTSVGSPRSACIQACLPAHQ